ncbi:uncharacterized protein LOC143276490 isoform X2 [Babylonia areolata]|uniref:uncharacterized protein LOC143276490 isoform X2 n=1 Tax=Babylonia areolata TaxID=304850 RepID=UPI003FD2157B
MHCAFRDGGQQWCMQCAVNETYYQCRGNGVTSIEGQCRYFTMSAWSSLSQGSLLWSLLVVVTAFLHHCECQPTTCRISVPAEGGNASLTCYYPYNMSVVKYDLLVQRFNISSNHVETEEVLACVWNHPGYRCSVHDSRVSVHTSLGNVSWNLILGVPLPPAAVRQEEGYVCLEAGSLSPPAQCTFPAVVAPDPPEVWPTQTTNTSVSIRWACPRDGGSPVLGYELKYTRGKNAWQLASLGAENTSFRLAGLSCGTLCHFVVRAVNTVGWSPQSDTLHVTTNGSVPAVSAGSDLVRDVSATTVTLNLTGFEADGCPVRSFSVRHRRHTTLTWIDDRSHVPSREREVTVRGLEPSTQYTVVVTAFNDAGNSTADIHVHTLPPPRPHHNGSAEENDDKETMKKTKKMVTALVSALTTLVALITIVLIVLFIRHRRNLSGSQNDRSPSADNYSPMERMPEEVPVIQQQDSDM